MNDLRNRILTIFNESQEITFDLDNDVPSISILQLNLFGLSVYKLYAISHKYINHLNLL